MGLERMANPPGRSQQLQTDLIFPIIKTAAEIAGID